MRQKQTRQEKLDDLRIDKAYRLRCPGVQIDILDIPKIFRAGREAIQAGADDAELERTIVTVVSALRRN